MSQTRGFEMTDITDSMRKYSSLVVDGIEAAPARAMLRAVGFTDADFRKPQIGIASTWANVTPCNMHIDKLAQEAEKGANAAGGKAVIFNTITISDGIANGTEGMKYSLVSREVIADSIEAVVGSHYADSLLGGSGDDTFSGRRGADLIDGAGGHDEADYGGDVAGVTVRLGGWVGATGALPACRVRPSS